MRATVEVVQLVNSDGINVSDLERINVLLHTLSTRTVVPLKLSHVAFHLIRGNAVFLARDRHLGGRIVGLAELVIVRYLSGAHAEIQSVIVDEQYRGEGLGAALTQRAIALARQDPTLKRVQLTSKPHRTAAHRLYQGLGFKLAATACEGGTNLYFIDLQG